MEIRTHRLLLRPPLPADARGALEMLADPETSRWSPCADVVDEASALVWCLARADRSAGDHASWHAVLRTTGDFVGSVSVFSIESAHLTAHVGYRIHPARRGHGYAQEALRAATSWAFAELGIERLQLEHDVDNLASCAVALGAGYAFEGVLRGSYREADGSRRDEHVHGRLAVDPGFGSATPPSS